MYLAAFSETREQVLGLIRHGGLLTFRGRPHPEWTQVGSLERAEALAGSQDLDLVPVIWGDVYAAELSRAQPAQHKHRVSAGPVLRAWPEEVRRWTQAFLPEPFWTVEDSISADLANIAEMRAALGTSSPLVEQMLCAYQEGGWPCGLDAKPPAGRLCVLWAPQLLQSVGPESPRLIRQRILRSKLRKHLLADGT